MPKHSYSNLRTKNPKEYWRLRYQEYKKTHNIQKQTIAEILENLIKKNNNKGFYYREDIETAIIAVRGVDKRTRDNWFNLLWKLEYIHQPTPNHYIINISKVPELELACRLSPQLSSKQQRLGRFC